MSLLTIIILALLQGVTEFLPISSSGHLVLGGAFLENMDAQEAWDQHMAINVAVHVGTLFAVLLYFYKDVWVMICGAGNMARFDLKAQSSRLNLNILIGSIPVILAGLALHVFEPSWLLAVEIIAWTTLIFGIVLWVVDVKAPSEKKIDVLGYKDAFLIGLAQCLALVPGTSRSGITMTAARALGYERPEAARFSLLLAIVAIAGAGALESISMFKSGNLELGYFALLAMFISFVAGWISIALMMKWLERASFKIFAIYRIVLGVGLLAYLYAPFLGLSYY